MRFLVIAAFFLSLGSVRAQAPQKTYVYDTVAGTRLLMDYYAPAFISTAGAPVLLFIHGGCFSMGSRRDIPADVKKMTEDGFAVFSVDYRPSTVAKYPAAVTDVQQAVRAIRRSSQRLKLNPGQIFVHGESAGGYLAAILGVRSLPDRQGNLDHHSAPVRFVSDWFGRTDFTAPQNTGTDCAEGFLGLSRNASTMEAFRRASVTASVHPSAAKFLMIHGSRDQQVYPVHSTNLATALKRLGKSSALYFYQGQGHGFPRAIPWALTRQAMLEELGVPRTEAPGSVRKIHYRLFERGNLQGSYELGLNFPNGDSFPLIASGSAADFPADTRTLGGWFGVIAGTEAPVLVLKAPRTQDQGALELTVEED